MSFEGLWKLELQILSFFFLHRTVCRKEDLKMSEINLKDVWNDWKKVSLITDYDYRIKFCDATSILAPINQIWW